MECEKHFQSKPYLFLGIILHLLYFLKLTKWGVEQYQEVIAFEV